MADRPPGHPSPTDAPGAEHPLTADQTVVMQPPATPPAADAPTAPVTPQPPAEDVGWVAEVWVDPDWYALQSSADPMPAPGPPEVVELHGSPLLVGRVSRSRDIHPEIACEADSGVSRRQAELSTDGGPWYVEDLGSANGTFVGPVGGALPERPVPTGQRVQLRPDDAVYVGAWTKIVLRRADAGPPAPAES